MELSRSTSLLSSAKSKVVDCLKHYSQCHPLRDVPVAMCQYEKELALESSKRDVIAGFDLNEEPPPDLHTIKWETEPSGKTTSFYTGTIVCVIHLELDKEVELFKCYECFFASLRSAIDLRPPSVFMVDRERRKRGRMEVVFQDLSFTKQLASPRVQFNFGNYHRLQQLSADDVMFIFCGSVIGTRAQPSKCGKRPRKRTASKDYLADDRKYAACISLLEKKDADSQKVRSRSDETI